MTIELLNPDNSGDIPPIDSLGVEPTRDLSAHLCRRDTTGETTRNLAHEIAGLPPRRRPANDETAKIRLVDVPLGLSSIDLAAVQPISPWSRVIDIESTVVYRLDGELRPAPPGPNPVPLPPTPPPTPPPPPPPAPAASDLRRSVPYVMPADRAPFAGPRHAKPAPLWTRVVILVGGAMLVGAFLGLAALAVVR